MILLERENIVCKIYKFYKSLNHVYQGTQFGVTINCYSFKLNWSDLLMQV